MKKRTILRVAIMALFLAITMGSTSCADSKSLVINGKEQIVEPYGWFDMDKKVSNVKYEVNTGNLILSIMFSETIIVPILITGDQLWEPVSVIK